jgi:hypothetical protein
MRSAPQQPTFTQPATQFLILWAPKVITLFTVLVQPLAKLIQRTSCQFIFDRSILILSPFMFHTEILNAFLFCSSEVMSVRYTNEQGVRRGGGVRRRSKKKERRNNFCFIVTLTTGCYGSIPMIRTEKRQFLVHMCTRKCLLAVRIRRVAKHSGTCVSHGLRAVLCSWSWAAVRREAVGGRRQAGGGRREAGCGRREAGGGRRVTGPAAPTLSVAISAVGRQVLSKLAHGCHRETGWGERDRQRK